MGICANEQKLSLMCLFFEEMLLLCFDCKNHATFHSLVFVFEKVSFYFHTSNKFSLENIFDWTVCNLVLRHRLPSTFFCSFHFFNIRYSFQHLPKNHSCRHCRVIGHVSSTQQMACHLEKRLSQVLIYFIAGHKKDVFLFWFPKRNSVLLYKEDSLSVYDEFWLVIQFVHGFISFRFEIKHKCDHYLSFHLLYGLLRLNQIDNKNLLLSGPSTCPQTSKTLLFFIVLLYFFTSNAICAATTKPLNRLSCCLDYCFSFMCTIREHILRIVVIPATFHSLNNL